MYKSKLTLTAAALTMLGAASVFAFTPAISPIPDVIMGNRTPTDAFTPGDSFTAGDTIEGQNGEPLPDSFFFGDALNAFDLVEDTPSGVAGATADVDLVYVFNASGVMGGSDNSLEIEGTLIPPTGASVTPDTDGTLDFEDVVSTTASNLGFTIDYPFSNGAGDVTVFGAQVGNASGVTLTVTNSQGNSASQEFMAWTVIDNPDSLSGGGIPVITTNDDLSLWVYNPIPISSPADPNNTGTRLADQDGDGSGEDLQISISDQSPGGAQAGQSFESISNWTSPFGLIPFNNENTSFRVRYNVSAVDAATSTSTVEARVRWFYGNQGNMGNGNTVARPRLSRPSASGTTYAVMFDNQPVASANETIAAEGVAENSIALQFEALDIFNAYGGSVTLRQVQIDQMPTDAVVANQQVEFTVADFTTDTADISATVNSAVTIPSPGAVSRTSGSATLNTPGVNPGTPGDFGGFLVNLIDAQLSTIAVTPSGTSGLIYRTEFDIDASGNTVGAPYPELYLRVRTVNGNVAADTTETILNSQRSIDIPSSGALNPGYSTNRTYPAYHHFPSAYDLTTPADPGPNGLAYGDGVAATVAITDLDDRAGNLTISGITINSVPESLLP